MARPIPPSARQPSSRRSGSPWWLLTSQLGHAPSVANAAWPVIDPTLRADETVTLVVQVQGKVRAKLEVPVGITEAEATAAALADANVERALAGRAVRQVIVRLPKMVSIVPA